jgi:hypothetical protein
LVHESKYFFYVHALTEAKKDGVTPEDAIYVILNGDLIEDIPNASDVSYAQCCPTRYHCTWSVTSLKPTCY